jgi:hypothetical protein
MIGNSGSIAVVALATPRWSQPVRSGSQKELVDDRLQLLQNGIRNIRWLQPVGDIASNRDGRRAVTAPQNGVFHAHIDSAHL